MKVSGQKVSPIEIENVLMKHPAVSECAVVGRPDELRGEIVKAVVVLKEGYKGAERSTLEEEMRRLVREQFAAFAYPREISFVDALPKTPSGKVQRFLLKS